MAKMSSSEQPLAAAIGDFRLVDRGESTPILGTVPHAYFVQAFSLWFEVRTEAQCLLRGTPRFHSAGLRSAEASSVWEPSAGLSARAVLRPVICTSAAAPAHRYLCFPPGLGFQRKTSGETKQAIFV